MNRPRRQRVCTSSRTAFVVVLSSFGLAVMLALVGASCSTFGENVDGGGGADASSSPSDGALGSSDSLDAEAPDGALTTSLGCANEQQLLNEAFTAFPSAPPWMLKGKSNLRLDQSTPPGSTAPFLVADVTTGNETLDPGAIVQDIQVRPTRARLSFAMATLVLGDYAEIGCSLGLVDGETSGEFRTYLHTTSADNVVQATLTKLSGKSIPDISSSPFPPLTPNVWQDFAIDINVPTTSGAPMQIDLYQGTQRIGSISSTVPELTALRVECGVIYVLPPPTSSVTNTVAIDNVRLDVCP